MSKLKKEKPASSNDIPLILESTNNKVAFVGRIEAREQWAKGVNLGAAWSEGVKVEGERMEVLFRLPQILRIIPVSKSTWWAGCRDGRFPKPIHLSKRVSVWRGSDIRRLILGEKDFS